MTVARVDDQDGSEHSFAVWVPPDIDTDRPNAARMYDYALGGNHNFAVDREMVERAEVAVPGARMVAHANRAFLGRVVRWLAAAGVRQFLDLGSGIPTLGNVHEVAQNVSPDARVVYVDIDPVAVEHGKALLADSPLADMVAADVRRPADILGSAVVNDLLDFTQPVAVLMLAVLHFVPDSDDPIGIVAQFMNAIPAGSYIALSHGATPPPRRSDDATLIKNLYQRTASPLHLRDRDELAQLIAGMQTVDPGLVAVSQWHPDPDEVADVTCTELLAVLAQKPASTNVP